MPARAVVQIGLLNAMDIKENSMGARETGSSLERRIDLHEAESGGGDWASLHVPADRDATIQFYDQAVDAAHQFYLFGYWK